MDAQTPTAPPGADWTVLLRQSRQAAALSRDDVARRSGISAESLRAYETGRTGRDAFADAIIAEFGLPVDAETFLGECAWWPRSLHPDAGALLASLV